MGIHISWVDIHQTRLYIRFENQWNVHQFQNMILQIKTMIGSQPHQVHLIADFTASERPTNALLTVMPFAVRHVLPNQGTVVVVSSDVVVKTLARTALAIQPTLRSFVYVVDNLALGERILAHFDKAVAQSQIG